MEMITLTINGQTVQAPKNATILEAARSAGIHIPTLCYHSELAPEGACRLCVVEATRSEERRVGKECRSRWSPYH